MRRRPQAALRVPYASLRVPLFDKQPFEFHPRFLGTNLLWPAMLVPLESDEQPRSMKISATCLQLPKPLRQIDQTLGNKVHDLALFLKLAIDTK